MMIVNRVSSFFRVQEGASAPEYSVMIALVILVVLLAVVFLGQQVESLFNDFGSLVAPFFGGS